MNTTNVKEEMEQTSSSSATKRDLSQISKDEEQQEVVSSKKQKLDSTPNGLYNANRIASLFFFCNSKKLFPPPVCLL